MAKPHAASALVVLLRQPGISAAALAREMGANQPITGRVMANHLKDYGLASVRKVAGPFGRDATSITLTAAGEKVARALGRLADVPSEPPRRKG